MGDSEELNTKLRLLPAVDKVVGELGSKNEVVTSAARRAVDEARTAIRSGGPAPTLEDLVAATRELLEERERSHLQPVLNATGVLIHTNLGRVPLGAEQLEAAARIGSGYSNLEYDLAAGRRGDRYSHATRLIAELTGAEAALVVNNNAAAVLLTLVALCSGKEVIISRGELVEIGGEFRIPEVMAASGATLVEVGSTNRTHIGDFERAITPNTGALLKVHPSNYRMVGFTAAVSGRDLARLARGRGLCLIHDLGSGLVVDEPSLGSNEPVVSEALRDGADLVTFSGDKLLGGPQAGVIAGRGELVDKISRHPMVRALRPDKFTLAALETTLKMYLDGRHGELPLWKMALASVENLRARAERVVAQLEAKLPATIKLEAIALSSTPGGGALPEFDLSSYGLSLVDGERSSAELQRRLRYAEVPVIARVESNRLLLDLRTVPEEQTDLLVEQVTQALSEGWRT
jgi:L-seryl-tRNA(Ser) seleniumtransferase